MNFMSFSELKWKENSALKKATVGSSVKDSDYGYWDPGYSTDGLVQNGSLEMFHSNYESSHWIKVDLINALTISIIRVFNRGDVLGNYHNYDLQATIFNL